MDHQDNAINRRQALGLTASWAGIGLTPDRPMYVHDQPNELAQQIRELHHQLALFNDEIVPRLVDGRSDAPAYRPCRVHRFAAMSKYLRCKLDRRSVQPVVEYSADHLRQRLEQLHVRIRLDCSCFDESFVQHPAMAFLRNEHGMPGHAFASLAWGISPQRMRNCAEQICMWLERPGSGSESFDAIRNASCSDLEDCFTVMDLAEYFDLIEALFSIRPATPVSFLRLQSDDLIRGPGVRAIMSTMCGNLMERLANNHFDQTLAIARLPECEGSWHGFIAGQVFDILMQKWLCLMGSVQSDETIELEETGDLSMAMQRGVVESMLNASNEKRQSSQMLTNSGKKMRR